MELLKAVFIVGVLVAAAVVVYHIKLLRESNRYTLDVVAELSKDYSKVCVGYAVIKDRAIYRRYTKMLSLEGLSVEAMDCLLYCGYMSAAQQIVEKFEESKYIRNLAQSLYDMSYKRWSKSLCGDQ